MEISGTINSKGEKMEIKDTLKYFKFCFQKRNDQRFIKNIYRIENDDSLVNIQKMDGEKKEFAVIILHRMLLDLAFLLITTDY